VKLSVFSGKLPICVNPPEPFLNLLRGPTPVLALASVILSRLPDSLKQGNARGVNFWTIDGIIHANS